MMARRAIYNIEDATPHLEKLRKQLSEAGFGVTLIGHHLTLRKDGFTYSFVFVELETDEPACDGCGQRLSAKPYTGHVTSTVEGFIIGEHTMELCSDCGCPK